MQKIIGFIAVLFVALLLAMGLRGASPELAADRETVSVVEDRTEEGYMINVEYPRFDSTAYFFVNEDIEAFVSSTTNAFVLQAKEIMQWVKETKITGLGIEGGSSLHIRYAVATTTRPYLAIRFDISEYAAGAAHPNTAVVTKNYDLSAKRRIELRDLFVENADYLSVIARSAKRELQKKFIADGLPPDAAWLEEGSEPKPENYETWLVAADGLHVIFGQYQVAPYAYGISEVRIPWTELTEIMK